MKFTNIFIAAASSMFFVAPVFAGNEKMVDNQSLAANLAKASSPENVKAVALQQKKSSCDQNAKNKKLEGSNKEEYLTLCMNKNEALLAFETINNQRLASSDINEMLRQSPTAAGKK
jgi:hypothetical protein